jgi:hypothetical protein
MPTSKKIRLSRRQEEGAAARIGGRVTPRSGAGWVHKNDAKSDRFLVECKRTDNKFRLSLSLNDLHQLSQNAILSSKLDAMAAEIGTERYWVLTDRTFAEMLLELGWVVDGL